MNTIEKRIYDLVKRSPKIKNLIRNSYQKAFDVLGTPAPQSAYKIKPREGFFFGFHDHTPFSADEARLLANRFDTPLRMPRLGETLQIGYFDGLDYSRFIPVAETRAWIWHTGCKLQWRGVSNEIVFNDHDAGRNIARIVDTDTGITETLPDSIGSVSPDGVWAVGYSFARLGKCMPGYGYDYDVGDTEIDHEKPRAHGIHIIHLRTKSRRVLYSLHDLANMRPEETMKGALHFATHTVFSPDSKRFVFLHRWIQRHEVSKRWTRMVSCDIDGNNLHIFPTIGMVSHIGWRNSEQIVAYCRLPKYDDRYVLFNVNDSTADYQIIGQDQFNSDGHPSFEPSGRWMVTDTYPDRRRLQSLLLYDTHRQVRYDIAKIPMPAKYQSPSPYHHWSCDLHPRWDRSGRRICFDSTYTGTRSLCTIDLNSDLTDDDVKYLHTQ